MTVLFMIDTQYQFEELPILVGTIEIACCTGTALLEGETGPHDYGFSVTGIALEGHHVADYRDRRLVQISAGCDDPLGALIFARLAERIERDVDAQEHFGLAVRAHLAAVA